MPSKRYFNKIILKQITNAQSCNQKTFFIKEKYFFLLIS